MRSSVFYYITDYTPLYPRTWNSTFSTSSSNLSLEIFNVICRLGCFQTFPCHPSPAILITCPNHSNLPLWISATRLGALYNFRGSCSFMILPGFGLKCVRSVLTVIVIIMKSALYKIMCWIPGRPWHYLEVRRVTNLASRRRTTGTSNWECYCKWLVPSWMN
jgi:hypothetical protein